MSGQQVSVLDCDDKKNIFFFLFFFSSSNFKLDLFLISEKEDIIG